MQTIVAREYLEEANKSFENAESIYETLREAKEQPGIYNLIMRIEEEVKKKVKPPEELIDIANAVKTTVTFLHDARGAPSYSALLYWSNRVLDQYFIDKKIRSLKATQYAEKKQYQAFLKCHAEAIRHVTNLNMGFYAKFSQAIHALTGQFKHAKRILRNYVRGSRGEPGDGEEWETSSATSSP